MCAAPPSARGRHRAMGRYMHDEDERGFERSVALVAIAPVHHSSRLYGFKKVTKTDELAAA